MANTGFKGIDVKQTAVGGGLLLFDVFETSSGAVLATGTTTLEIYELQSNGSLNSYDFSSNSFKSTALTTATASMTAQSGNNSTTTTGIWTYAISTLTGFTIGAIYYAVARNSGADAPVQVRKFQYGSAEGDLIVTSSGGTYLQADVRMVNGSTGAANNQMYTATYFMIGSGTFSSIPSSTTAVLQTAFGDNTRILGCTIVTSTQQVRTIVGYVDSTKTITVNIPWGTTPTSNVYVIFSIPTPSLDSNLAVTANGVNGNLTGAVNSVTSGVTVTTNSDKSGYSLATAPPTATAIATQIWQDLLASSDFGTAGSIGALLKTDIDTNIGSRLATSGYTAPTTPPTAAAIATALWTDLLSSSDFSTASSIGNILKTYIDAHISGCLTPGGTLSTVTNLTNAPIAGDFTSAMKTSLNNATPTATVAAGSITAIAAAVWSVLTSTLTTANSIGVAVMNFLAGYVVAPTAVQNRQEMDANSTKLAAAATATGLSSAEAAIIAAVGSPLQTTSYTAPPSADSIATATATVLFVDGIMNPLKVNSNHTVNLNSEAVSVANYITVPAAVALASQIPSVISCLRGDTLRVSLPTMGDISTRTKLVMTVKANLTDADDQAVIQIVEGVGLVLLNAGQSVTASTASLTVVDPTTGAVNLEIDASVTAAFAIRDLVWDVQAYLSSGINSPISGAMSVVADVTQAVT